MSRIRTPGVAGLVGLVSASSIGFELFLTRYFAVANWAEYGYWIISIAMSGLALGGLAAGLAPRFMRRHARGVLAAAALGMPVCAAVGYAIAVRIPFNPLALQNRDLWAGQLLHIGLYDLALTPFFFCVGLCLTLAFLADPAAAAVLYAADLGGAGLGAVWVLLLLGLLRPFDLPLGLLPLMGVAAWLGLRRWRAGAVAVAAAAGLTAGSLWLAGPATRAGFFEYKGIFAPLHVRDARQVAEFRSPRGWDLLLDNFTERLDTDLSNNYGLLRAGGPPRSRGLYRDGERIAAVVSGPVQDRRYLRAALDSLPYRLLQRPRVLLIGAHGGFRPGEAVALGAGDVVTLEPDPVLRALLPPGTDARADAPLSYLATGPAPFDLIDIAAEFSGQNEANRSLFTVEGLRACLNALRPGGMVSLSAPIKDLPVYAVIAAATAREAVRRGGVAEAGRRVLVYRSAWNARILVARDPVAPATVAALRALCDERSFDVAYAAGDGAPPGEIWNDLPPVAFDGDGGAGDAGPRDALAEDLALLFGPGGDRWIARSFFDVAPRTLDRPNPRAALRPEALPAAMRHLELVPRDELPVLVAAGVGLQALVFAALIIALPLAFGRGGGAGPAAYFTCLGVGFLFVEIILIEKAAQFLGDRASAFGLVLAGMLLCSGLGSFWFRGAGHAARRTMAGAVAGIVAGLLACVAAGDAAILAGQGLSTGWKEVLLLVSIAPLGFALGVPFPLGLARFGGVRGDGIPWAWAVNGAASVLASPLASLLGQRFGSANVLLAAGALYLGALAVFRGARPR